ncbi:probable pectinesterase/pectinesterase inhibitor 64 [Diospyros lotus]|uniref:probable pectinesterase/pectinesterase inhibitor 64 n=1 Tax=Diospyros lotus TaxID=55363 RepID=UPI00224F7255|nr:probable pectinesterase/pectinesterase inhibitor 64 [Diospyros lotus]
MAGSASVAIPIAIVALGALVSAFLIILHSRSPSQESSSISTPENVTHPVYISLHQACGATRHPQTCESTLSSPPNQASANAQYDAVGMLQYATKVVAGELKVARNTVSHIADTVVDNQNVSRAAKICVELLENAAYRMSSTSEALPRGEIKDARAWMSAALVYESACMSGLNKTANKLPWANVTVTSLESLLNLTSDALSMMVSYDVFGNDTRLWSPPRTERDGFWEHVNGSGQEFDWKFPAGLMADVTVCNGGAENVNCDFKKVQEAVNAAPDKDGGRRFVISIKEGVYNETVRVPLQKKNVVFLGDGMGKTVITGSLNVGQPGMTTYDSATVGVIGDGFMARDLTIENTAGPDAHQALAFRSDSDRSILQNCEFLGNQDTLCANTLRQFYRSCRVQGNVDFVFGFSAAVFQDCLVLVSSRGAVASNNNVVSAHGRFDPAQSTGFVFVNCTVNGTDDYIALCKDNPKNCVNYLGRPWKQYSRTVFVRSLLGSLVAPQGWMPWDGDFALSTLYYGEFENSGPGSDLSQREKWSSEIPADHVGTYSVQNFIQGDKWIPTSF